MLTSHTLVDRMTSGRIPVAESLRIGMLLTDQLRQLHDHGAVHGGLTPAAIEIDGAGVQLLPAHAPAAAQYLAPEVAAGRPADARSDIYSFGAVLLEMLTGRPTFDASTGSPAVDRLMNGCLAKSPAARFQRVQKLQLELKMLLTAARRSAPVPAPPPLAPVPVPTPVVVAAPVPPPVVVAAPAPAPIPVVVEPSPAAAQMQELESRIAARMAEQEKSVANVAEVANQVLKALQQQQAAPAPAPPPAQPIRSRAFADLDEHSASRLEKALDLMSDKLARIDMVVGSVVERLQKLEETFDAFDTDAADLRDSVTRDIRNFERALKTQNTAIESARTAMGQTDDLVERVVEALDALQSMFVTTADERSLAS
jgi:serine/threonine-protein kinase